LDFALDVCNGVVEVPGSPSIQKALGEWSSRWDGKLESWKAGKLERLLHPQSSIVK
jgi:hypothetical protein